MLQALGIFALVVSGWIPSGGPDSIRADLLRVDVEELSSDAMSGRETGTAGARAASLRVAERFRNAGLLPLPGLETPLVEFTLYRAGHDPDGTSLATIGGAAGLRPGIDFRPLAMSADGEVTASVVFGGYGITAPEFDHDDYAGLDVQGKIVLVFRHEPGEDDPDSRFAGLETTRYSRFRTKAETAETAGASALLLVTDPGHGSGPEDMRFRGRLRLEPDTPDRAGRVSIPVLQVSTVVAASILGVTRDDLVRLQADLDGGRAATDLGVDPPREVRLAVRSRATSEAVDARNVVAMLPGSDPERRDDWIVVGAHHDHVGAFDGEGDTVFNGADDNASGTAAVVALAEAFAGLPEAPPRTLVFATFTGEEKGLLGSRQLVEDEILPPERVRFMLNLDMIGRNPDRALEVIGDGFGTGIPGIVAEANDGPDVALDLAGNRYFPNSDHHSFYRRDVPFLFLFSGTHEDYHGLGDHADRLDYVRMERIVRMAYGVLERVAELDDGPWFVRPVSWLGVRVQQGGPDDDGSTVVAVEPGSRGEHLGMRAADRLVSVDGSGAEPVARRLADVEAGARFKVRVERDGRTVTLKGRRPEPGYLGVSTEDVDASTRATLGLEEHVGVLIVTLVPGGPAEGAGLQVGDILVTVDGNAVRRRDLRSALERIGAGETVAVEVARGEARMTIDVTLGKR